MIYGRLIFLFLGLLFSIYNILLGLKLSWNPSESSDLHLISALLILACNLIGSFIMIITTKRQLEKRALLKNSTAELNYIIQRRESALRLSLLVIGISIVSLITGTTSQAGEIPWIHAALGIGLLVASVRCIYKWIRLFSAAI